MRVDKEKKRILLKTVKFQKLDGRDSKKGNYSSSGSPTKSEVQRNMKEIEELQQSISNAK